MDPVSISMNVSRIMAVVMGFVLTNPDPSNAPAHWDTKLVPMGKTVSTGMSVCCEMGTDRARMPVRTSQDHTFVVVIACLVRACHQIK